MRHSGYDSTIIKAEDGSLSGINLKGAGCAEHEWGIKQLEDFFAINRSIKGTEGRRARALPEGAIFRFEKKGQKAILYKAPNPYINYQGGEDETSRRIQKMLKVGKDCLFSSAWDEKSFAIHVFGRENSALLKELYEAFLRLDVTMSIGSSANPFDRPGLWFMVASKLSEEMKAGVLAGDIEFEKKEEAKAKKK